MAMSDGCEYVPVHRVQCTICGGISSVIHRGDPNGKRWVCPHHGEGGEDNGFVQSGVGEIGQEYDYIGMVVVQGISPREIDADTDVLEQDVDTVDEVRFRDFEAVEVRGDSNSQRASERGVTESTVRQSRMTARKSLCVGGDGDGE